MSPSLPLSLSLRILRVFAVKLKPDTVDVTIGGRPSKHFGRFKRFYASDTRTVTTGGREI